VPKNTGTTAQSLAGAAPGLAGGGTGVTERVVGRAAPSLSALLISSSLAPTLGGTGGGGDELTGGGGDELTGGGGDDAEGAGDGDTEEAGDGDAVGAGDGDGAGAGDTAGGATAGSAGATDRFMAKVRRLGSAPADGGCGTEAVLGKGAIGRLGADTTGGAVSLAKVDRL
jgi:hypothetical protein